MSHRRPNTLQFTVDMEDRLKLLEMSTDAHLIDQRLAALTKLQRIAEESLATVGLDSSSRIDFSDPRTRIILKGCADRILLWKTSLPKHLLTEILELHYLTILITLYEAALYDKHNLADFKPPFVIRAVPLEKEPIFKAPRETANAIATCMTSARALLDTFAALPTNILLSMPVIVYIRMVYGVVVLIKIYVSVQSPHGLIHEVDQELSPKLRVGSIIEQLRHAAGQQRFRVPATFHAVLLRVSMWCIQNLHGQRHKSTEDLTQPLLHLHLEPIQNSTDSQGEDKTEQISSQELDVSLEPALNSSSLTDEPSIEMNQDFDMTVDWNLFDTTAFFLDFDSNDLESLNHEHGS
jgi:hypothetical protein